MEARRRSWVWTLIGGLIGIPATVVAGRALYMAAAELTLSATPNGVLIEAFLTFVGFWLGMAAGHYLRRPERRRAWLIAPPLLMVIAFGAGMIELRSGWFLFWTKVGDGRARELLAPFARRAFPLGIPREQVEAGLGSPDHVLADSAAREWARNWDEPLPNGKRCEVIGYFLAEDWQPYSSSFTYLRFVFVDGSLAKSLVTQEMA